VEKKSNKFNNLHRRSGLCWMLLGLDADDACSARTAKKRLRAFFSWLVLWLDAYFSWKRTFVTWANALSTLLPREALKLALLPGYWLSALIGTNRRLGGHKNYG
jgi:hypothetical protein